MSPVSLIDRLRLRMRSQLAAPFERRVRAPLRGLRNARRQYRPIFVTGAAGSGTSLVASSLAQEFECAGFVYELDSQISKRSFLSVADPDTFASVAAYERCILPSESWSVEAGRRDLLDLFRSYGSGSGNAMVVKGPDIVLVRAAFLAECFPDAHFVLVFRDPVVNLEGWRRKWRVFGDDSMEECIRLYASMHESFLRFAEARGHAVLGVPYEEFVARPDEQRAAIGDRLGLAPARRRRALATKPDVAGMGIRNVRNNRIGVVTDANQQAYERLGSDAAEEIRRALGELHTRLQAASFNL